MSRNDRERTLKTLLGPAASVLQVRRPGHSVRPEIPAPHTDATGIECGTKCLEFCKCTQFTHNGLLRLDPFLIGMRFRHVYVRAKCLRAKLAGLGELDTRTWPMHYPARIKGFWPGMLATGATCLYKPKAFQMFLKTAGGFPGWPEPCQQTRKVGGTGDAASTPDDERDRRRSAR